MKVVPVGDSEYQLYCASCGKETDIVNREEVRALVTGDYGLTLCPMCESTSQDRVPNALEGDPPYLLKVMGRWHLIDPWQECTPELAQFVRILQKMQNRYNEGRIGQW